VIIITYNGNTPTKNTWVVPADWNSADNTITAIGGGGAGVSSAAGAGAGGGGGGGYSKSTNLSLTLGANIAYQVGNGGRKTTVGAGAGTAGTASFFNRTAGSAGTCADTVSVCANPGSAGSTTTGGAGGSTTGADGTTLLAGGAGGAGNSTGDTSGGGGGAGGTAIGQVGGAGNATTSGGGGGGGGAGGTSSSVGQAGQTGTGGTGGNGPAGTGSGAAGNAGHGGAGTAATGGGGGGGDDVFGGGVGGSGSSTTYGGGGGGGAGDNNTAATSAAYGGHGGLHGGGGGGGLTNGFGAEGIIIITYTPVISVSGNVYSVSGGTETICDASGVTQELSLRAGATTYTASCADSTGAYTFNLSAAPADGDPIVVWIEGLATDGATVIRHNGTGISTSNALYESTVSITSDNTTPADILDLNLFDNVDDSDIPYTATDAATDTLSVNSNFNLRINLKTGVAAGSTVFDPNGTITTQGTGSLHIDDNAIAFLDTATNTIASDILVDAGAKINIDADTTITGGDITVLTTGDVSSSAGTTTLASSGTIGGGSTGSVFQLTNLSISSGTTTLGTDSDNILDFTGDITVGTGTTLAMNDKTANVDGGNVTTTTTGSITCASCTTGGLTLSGDGTTNGIGGGSGAITFYNLTLDGSANTTAASTAITVTNDITIGANRTFTSPSSTLTVGHNFANSGTFTHNSGTVSLNGATDSTQTISGATTFYNLSATNGDRVIIFTASTTYTVSNNITLQGDSCLVPISVRSSIKGTAYTFTDSAGGTTSATYLDIQDTNATNAITLSNSVDSGGNTNLTIAANACISSSTDATSVATGYSFQRKQIYDDQNARYWSLNHDGDEIEIRYSSDGAIWSNPATAASGHLAYDTNDFTVWYKSISTVEYIFLAVASGNDILLRRGTLSASDITWESTVITALNGTSATDSYSHPSLSLDSSNYLWVGARHYGGANYSFKTVRSDDTDTADIATWSNMGFGTTIPVSQVSDDQTNANVFGNIVPLGSQDMYVTFAKDTAIEGCKWVHTSSAWQNSAGASCSPTSSAGETITIGGTAVNIDNASDFGALPGSGRQVVRTLAGTLYAFVNDLGSCEIWKSTTGATWALQGSGKNCDSNSSVSLAINGSDVLQLIWSNATTSNGVMYDTFATSTDTFGALNEVVGPFGTGITYDNIALATDANNIPHVIYVENDGSETNLRYDNRIGGTWNSGEAGLETNVTGGTIDITNTSITINESGFTEIVYYDAGSSTIRAQSANANDPSAWATHDVDASGSEPSIDIDTLTGNTWISYRDTGGTISLAKFAGVDYTDFATGGNWSTITTKTDVGSEPSIAISQTSDIFVFYQEDSTDQKIVYDIYNSQASSPSWVGEVVLQTPGSGVDFGDVRVKSSFEWNNYGANKIDYLFSDGTDVFWNFLYLRRTPTKIDDASDFAQLGGKQIVRTSDGTLYASIVRSGLTNYLEMWKSTNDGDTWTEQDSANSPFTSDYLNGPSIAVDSNDFIHIIYSLSFDGPTSSSIKYTTFSTIVDQWNVGSPPVVEEIEADTVNSDIFSQDIAIDSNNVPHIVYKDGNVVQYGNRAGFVWTVINVESVANNSISIVVNEDNIPEISYHNTTDNDLTAAVGADNDPDTAGQWTLYDVDTDIKSTWQSTTLGVDSAGNTWIAYVDENGTNDYATIYKQDDGTTWTTAGNWHQYTNSKVGITPSIAINGTDIFVFYSDDQDDIVYDTYANAAWQGESLLEENGNILPTVDTRYSFLPNQNYGTYGIDYLYTTISDIHYNRLLAGTITPGSQDAIATTTNGLTYNLSAISDTSSPYDVHLAYLDNSATKKVIYNRWDNNGASSAWQTPVTIDETVSSTNMNVNLTLDTTTKDLWASWVDQTGDDHIYDKQCNVTSTSDECSTGGNWGTRTSENTATGAVYNSLTSNYSSPSKVFGAWTNTVASPFSVSWGSILSEVVSNTSPNSPSSLAQKTTSDVTITTGGWTNTTSVKFTATATDTDNPDTLQLCVEKDLLGTGFSNTEDSCGTGVTYSGAGVTVTNTITSQTDASQYHWQARVKDTAGAYSTWVSYDANAESARDYGLDSTAPTGGTVYDGTSAGVDSTYSDSSLSALSANWGSINTDVSGLNKYEYSIGTTVGGTQIKTWTDNTTSTSVTTTGLTLSSSTLYYVNVRTTDNAGNVSSVISSNGQLVSPSISFTVSPLPVTFVNINAANSYSDTKTTTLTTSTNAYNGYVIRAFVSDYLRSTDGASTIPDFTAGSYATPATWAGAETGLGYTSSDTTIGGANKFATGTLYAPFNHTGPGDIVADHTNTVSGTPVANEVFTLTYKVKTPATQEAKRYSNTVILTATAQY
jgi:hypothetical protein